jgi:DNA-binding transcriptional LysR family regulator
MNDIDALLSRGGLSLERLATLCRVADAGGLSKAAGGDASRLSQYSRQVKDLEAFFGVPLLGKVGRVGVPTPAARAIAAASRGHLKALQAFVGAQAAVSPLTLGGSHSLLEWHVVPRLGALQKALGGNRTLKLLAMRSREIAEALEEHRLDVGLARSDAFPRGLEKQHVLDVGYALFVPIALVRGQSARQVLQSVPLALSLGGQLRQQIDAGAEREGIRLNIAAECASFTLAADVLRTGSCAAILPAIASSSLDPGKVARMALPFRPEPARRVVAAWHRSSPAGALRGILKVLGA